MGKKHTPSTRKRALSKQKNKIRGLIASGKSHAYTPKAHDKVGQVRRDLSDALAAAGALGLAAGGKFLRWADAQVAQQLPELRSKPPVSELTTDALERKPRALTIEIEWASELLRPHLSEIIAFRALADQVEEAALLENWSEAVARLEDVESTFGRSIWWLEAHIAIQQAHQGLDAQKQWTASYRDLRPGSLQSYLARFFSVRNEPSTTLNSFLKDVDERVGRLKQQPTLQGYLRTKLLWNAPLSQRELAQSLVVAQSLAPVDLYETLLDALHHGFVFNYSQSLGETIRRALSTLRAISDSRVLTLAMLAERSTYNLPPHRPYAASDNAVSASATNVLAACTRELAQAPRAFRTALLAAAQLQTVRLASDAGPPGHWRQVIRRVATALAFDDSYAATSLDLERYLRNHSYSPTLRACSFAVKAILADDEALSRRFRQIAALNNSFTDADDFDVYPSEVMTAAVSDLASRGPLPDIVLATLAASDGSRMPSDLLAHYAVFLKVQRARGLLLIDELREYDRKCSLLNHRGLRVLVRRAFLGALFESGSVAEALQVSISSLFELHVPTGLLPLTTTFQSLRWKELRAYASEAALPIVLHVTWQVTGSDLVASNLRSATNAFCIAHGVTSIADLRERLVGLPTVQAVYFLRYVCVPEILDMCSFVGSSRAASECRREVCVILSDVDPDNKPIYDGETFAITRALSVQEGIRVLDSSRIHVDTSALTSWAIREWGPNIARYKALVEAGVGTSESFEDVLKDLSNRTVSPRKLLEMPKSDADSILGELIGGLRVRFLQDPNHGLDSYLSRRVRHHSMSGYLRGALENERLVTTKHSTAGRYQANSYWPQRLDSLSAGAEQQLQRALGKFCEDFDNVVVELKTQILRIRSDETPKGVFALPISPQMFYLVRAAAQMTFSPEDICIVCHVMFWAALRPELDAARRAITNDARAEIATLFHRLKASLQRIFSDSARYAELTVAIERAREDLSRKVTTVADWFIRTESLQSTRPFALDQALDICVESAMYSCRPFVPSIATHVEPGGQISAPGLTQLSDLILTSIGNVHQHSKCKGKPTIDIHLSVREDRTLLLRVESDIGKGASTAAARAKVDVIRSEIDDGSYLERVRREGRSGLMKMASIALAEQGGRIDFGFVEDKRFFVDIECAIVGHIVISASSAHAHPA